MNDKRLTDQIESNGNTSIIKGGTTIKGNISGDDEVYVEGKIDGSIILKSLLVLEKEGRVKGEVSSDNIIVEGKLEGQASVKNKIEIRKTGKFDGTVTCKQIAIEEGAFFQGEVKMEDGKELQPSYFTEKRKDLKEK